MIYGLPTTLEISGKEYEIRSDYRAILDIFAAINDPELNDYEKTEVLLQIFYVDSDSIGPSEVKEAVDKCFWFVRMGEEADKKPQPKLMDWEQDFFPLISAINRVAGMEVRSLDYLHWWTFVSYYNEIGGDCLFAQIVQIRDKIQKGKKLDKADKEFYNRNRDKIDFKHKYTQAEEDVMSRWLNGGELHDNTGDPG